MARPYVLALSLDEAELPLFVRIARALANDIARGRLRVGDPLPGSRTLAETLSVHRNTVNRAYGELVSQGWVESRPAKGVFVRGVATADRPKPFLRGITPRPGVPPRTGFALPRWEALPVGSPPGRRVLALSGGTPDPRLFPRSIVARAYRRALSRHAETVLDYGDARGHPALRAALARMLGETRGLSAGSDDLVLTRGSQMALYLVAHALFRPGDRVAVEALGYPPAWDAFRSAGAELVPIRVDAGGMDVDALEEACARGPLRAVYVTPHHQYPTLATLSASRRLRLMRLAEAHRLAILEDDYDHEYHYEGRPVLPLASVDRGGHVVYVGSLSKVLAPGLRIGYVVAPPPLLDRLSQMRTYIDRQGDAVAEAAVAELVEEGEVARHVRRMRRVYHARRDALGSALRDALGERVSFEVPKGGMALWLTVDPRFDVARWAALAESEGVMFRPGADLHIAGRARAHARLGYTRHDEGELARAVEILAKALPKAQRK